MKKRIFILFLTLALLIGLLTLLPVHSESDIYDNVLRLHVIANSDSESDQKLKLLVRDAILCESQKLLETIDNRSDAELVLTENVELLKIAAEKAVRENGYDYPVAVELGKENYPTKNYEACAFPSGDYTSLRVMIGDAVGENWWCVLFPPLCLSAATDKEAFTSAGITDGQYQIITETDKPKYKIRFKILESLSSFIE